MSMSKIYYFNTGLGGKDTIKADMSYNKDAGGYIASFYVGDRTDGQFFGWHIDADYFRYYQKYQSKLLVPAARRSEKKEQEAAKMLDENVLVYVQEFAAQAEAHGAPHMNISAA